MERSFERVLLLFWRALPLRCPNCGGGPIFDSWLRMRSRCPKCGLRLERGEQGYQVGCDLSRHSAGHLAVPPVGRAAVRGVALMVILPFLFYPFSKTLFLAFDLVFRPPGPNDFS